MFNITQLVSYEADFEHGSEHRHSSQNGSKGSLL